MILNVGVYHDAPKKGNGNNLLIWHVGLKRQGVEGRQVFFLFGFE